MKFFKWYIVDELDDFIYGRNVCNQLQKTIKYYQKINYEQYQEIEKLKKENNYLKNHLEIKIVNLQEGWLND